MNTKLVSLQTDAGKSRRVVLVRRADTFCYYSICVFTCQEKKCCIPEKLRDNT